MKFFNTALALTGFTLTTMAVPVDPTTPVHDVAPNTPVHDVAPTFPAPASSPPGNYCGKAVLTGTGRLVHLRTSEPWNKCSTLPEGENYGPSINHDCGLCVMFKDDDCQGDITYWGGKGAGSFDAKGARSYYCV